MMYFRAFCLVAGLATAFMGAAKATVISTYTDRGDWESALSGSTVTVETFDGAASSFSSFSTGNDAGSVSVELIGGVGDTGPTGLTGSGFFESEVDSSLVGDEDGLNVRLGHSPFTGFGLLNLQDDTIGSTTGLNLVEIGLLVDGSYFLVSDILGLTNSSTASGTLSAIYTTSPIPFIGFTTKDAISSFMIVHGDQAYAGGVSGASEEFYLDGLLFASSNNDQSRLTNNNVPEPGTVALMFVGLALLRVAKRRLKLF